jgi:hypothetical protein
LRPQFKHTSSYVIAVELDIWYQSETTYLRYSVWHQEATSGSFSFKAEGDAIDNKYYIELKNPASDGGLFGLLGPKGPTILVTVEFKVSGWTIFLK